MITAMKILYFTLFLLFSVGFSMAEEPQQQTFSAAINGHSVEVLIRYGKFENSKRIVESITEQYEDNGKIISYELLSINGHSICGTDNNRPGDDSEIIESITVIWDGEKQEISEKLFAHVVAPHQRDITFSMDSTGEALVVHMEVGDGGGSNAVSWRFGKDKQSVLLKELFFPLNN